MVFHDNRLIFHAAADRVLKVINLVGALVLHRGKSVEGRRSRLPPAMPSREMGILSVTNVVSYSYLNATIGSTLVARRAGR